MFRRRLNMRLVNKSFVVLVLLFQDLELVSHMLSVNTKHTFIVHVSLRANSFSSSAKSYKSYCFSPCRIGGQYLMFAALNKLKVYAYDVLKLFVNNMIF